MKIGIYKDTLANMRGADSAVVELAAGLRNRGHDICLFEKRDLRIRLEEDRDVLVSAGTVELRDLYAFFKYSARRGKLFPWPVVQQFHTNPAKAFKFKRFIRNHITRKALASVDAIQVLRDCFVPSISKFCRNIHVIENWSRFSPAPEPAEDSKKLIVYPAKWNKNKNQTLLLKAFEIASKNFPDWELRFYGNGRVSFPLPPGVKAFEYCDLTNIYKDCAFVAFPSLDEGFPLTLVEAAMFRKPAVVLYDWIGTAQTGGGLVAKANAEDFSKALAVYMSDSSRCRKDGKRAMDFCISRYSKKAILDKWEKLLNAVVEKQS